MGGGGKRRAANDRRRSGNAKSDDRRRARGKTTGRIRDALFVEGGLLSDFASPPGRNRNASGQSGPRAGDSDRTKALSESKSGARKSNGNAFGYVYPVAELQDKEPSSSEGNNRTNNLNNALTFLLLNSKDAQVIAYVDEKPCPEARTVEYAYNYSSSFVLGESSHKGVGFDDEIEATPDCVGSSSRKEEDCKEGQIANLPPSDEEMDGDDVCQEKEIDADEAIAFDLDEEVSSHQASPKENSAFISIGGMKLFTQDLSDGQSDEDYVDSAEEDSSEFSESGEGVNLSQSDGSENTFDSDSDIDEELAEDYLEGIGGNESLLDAKWLLENDINDSDEDTTSSSGFGETVERLGGIALQDASREYGMKKPQPRRNYPVIETDVCSSALDDIMLFKDPRTLSARKKRGLRMPQSWPMEARKSKSFRNFPGGKKKHRKEVIAAKRRERMLNRGVDLERINKKLEHIVSEGVDVFSFHPMHSKDCSQVQRLASIYGLRSACQGSGKKRFVTVSRTHNTNMSSANDRIHLEKLIGSEDGDFSVNEATKTKSSSGQKTKKFEKGNTLDTQGRNRSAKKMSSSRTGGMSRKRGSMKEFNAREPVLFVSSGAMQTETVETAKVESTEAGESSQGEVILSSAKVGAFELHTKGFGSRMMAKMGYVEGEGLGKAGQGIAQPIEVIQRPKSLGLGIDFSNTSDDPVENRPRRSEDTRKHGKGQSFGAFEKHTKGFGSKMMSKMGFVEGMGLGKDSQGITNPLVAVRLPKSRGLGAKS